MKKHLLLSFIYLIFTVPIVSQETEKPSTASKNVILLEQKFIFKNLNSVPHKIWVYLPPDYTVKKNNFYPVIYMHDGQNLFDNKTSFLGEWQVDEILNKIFKKTGKSFIVVGIENGGSERINEYTPWVNQKYGGGKGEAYIDFIVNNLKPFIDTKFRTKSDAKHTAIIGSSLGGLISYYGGLKYPQVFGKVGALSTSFWFSSEVEKFTKENALLKTTKLYLLVGDEEGETMVEDTELIYNLLVTNGFKSKNLYKKIVKGGKHNEAFWQSEFEAVISWLFSIK